VPARAALDYPARASDTSLMARVRALSAREVDAIKKPGVHWAAPSLYLQVRDDGTRSWLFRWMRHGKARWHGLGALRDVTLQAARQRAEELRVAVRGGADPVAEKRAAVAQEKAAEASKAPSFEWCARQVIAARKDYHKSDIAHQTWPSSMRDHAYPVIGSMPIDQVGLHEVHKVLAPIWAVKYPTASKVRGRIATILDWSAAKGYRPGMDNPARPNSPLDQLLPPVRHRERHHGSVPYPEVPEVVAKLRALDSVSARCLLFVILTGVRSGEARGAVWGEFNLAERLWVIPLERTKTSDEYRIPLSTQAVELLEALPKGDGLVFPNPKSGEELSYNALIEMQKGIWQGATPHGYRSSLSTWAREQTDYPAEVIEAALNHKQADKIVAAYARTTFFDKRRALLQEWADFCFGVTAEAGLEG
jgi:integrase